MEYIVLPFCKYIPTQQNQFVVHEGLRLYIVNLQQQNTVHFVRQGK